MWPLDQWNLALTPTLALGLAALQEGTVLQFVRNENLIHLRKQLVLAPRPSPQRDEILRQIAAEIRNQPCVGSDGNAD